MFAIQDDNDHVTDLRIRIKELENEVTEKNKKVLELEALLEDQREKEEQSRSNLELTLQRTHNAKVYFMGKADGISEEMDLRWKRNLKRTEQSLDYLIHLLAHRFGGKPMPENIVGGEFEESALWPKLYKLKSFVEMILEKRSQQVETLACEKAALMEEMEEIRNELEMSLREELQQVIEENKTLVSNLDLEINGTTEWAMKQEERLWKLERILKTKAREIKELKSELRSSDEVNFARYQEIGALNLEVSQLKLQIAQQAEEYLAAQQKIEELQAGNQAEVQQGSL